MDLMGQGTFGQVAKCRVRKTNQLVAVKVIKRQPAFSMQGDKEIQILLRLRDRPNKKDNFLQLQDCFTHRGHTCAVFELLSISLHKLFNQQKGRPNLTINDIQKISINILETLALLKEMGIIHTDLKPDNILMKSLDDIHDVKLIDYGSALLVTESLNYYVQTAFYRSPEVILHVPFNCAIDMWSFGCFVAEMFLGVPLFPSGNEYTLMQMMVSLLGCLPPDDMLKKGKRSNKFFHLKGDTGPKLRESVKSSHDITVSKSTLADIIRGFRSFDGDDDDSIINNDEDMLDRERLLDFLSKILVFDPNIRLDPMEALQHSFITSVASPVISEPSAVQPNNELSPAPVHLSSPNAIANNPSSINTSRTTEESPAIRTPPNPHRYINLSKSKEGILLSPSKSPYKSPAVTTISYLENKALSSPPQKVLKSILKKKSVADYQQFIQPQQQPAQQDNTLDARVNFLYNEPRPQSAVLIPNAVAPPYDHHQQQQHQQHQQQQQEQQQQLQLQQLQQQLQQLQQQQLQQQQYANYGIPTNNQLQNAMAVPTYNPNGYQQQQHQLQQQLVTAYNNAGYHAAQLPYVTVPSPLLYRKQYNVSQQAPVYPNRHFSPKQLL
ncbi:hypothetical protein INT47_007315 [Mucor saturninus]|uniref:Protein kinase domain-containing protein n=1 Tax=Mucor saturninus TaxID=64648 RepID=A0A8H7V167_9FUNG|nr:hypothetical protein INT47_007315 [Mucor saturninus]